MTTFSSNHTLASSSISHLAKELIQEISPDLSPSVDFSPEVNARLATVAATAQAAVNRANRKAVEEYRRLATKKDSQVQWITQAADMFGEAHKANSACKKGCAHCCHIPVSIGIAEAKSIAKALGKRITPEGQHIEVPKIGTPCPFLKNNTCSIYQNRPLICRTHMSMDQSDLLCQLQGDGTAIPVPYVNNLDIMVTAFEMTGPQFADIRQWFSIEGK